MELIVNGVAVRVEAESEDALLWALRDELGMTGTKFGCGIGICGACTVHLDGVAVRACVTPLAAVAGREVTTIEGLVVGTGAQERLHPVQRAFLELQVPQCSWCMSGQMMTAAAFLERNADPDAAEIIEAMDRNYCRCGCYARIRVAVARAAELVREEA